MKLIIVFTVTACEPYPQPEEFSPTQLCFSATHPAHLLLGLPSPHSKKE